MPAHNVIRMWHIDNITFDKDEAIDAISRLGYRVDIFIDSLSAQKDPENVYVVAFKWQTDIEQWHRILQVRSTFMGLPPQNSINCADYACNYYNVTDLINELKTL